MAGRRKGVFNPDGGVALPPSTEVIFNAAIVNNDGLVANSYARRHTVSYAQATQMLDADVAQLRAALVEQRQVSLPGIGTLALGEEGNMVFTPARSPEDYSARLGMAPLTLRAVASRVAEIQAEKQADRKPDADAPKAPVRLDKPLRSDKYYYIAINKMFARVAAIFILVVGVALAVILPQPGSVQNADSRDCASVIPIVNTTRPQPKKAQAAPAAKPAPKPQEFKYMLVVGTFTMQQEIDRFLEKHADSPIPLEVVKGRKYIYAVAGASDDITALHTRMTDSAFNARFQGAWISKN